MRASSRRPRPTDAIGARSAPLPRHALADVLCGGLPGILVFTIYVATLAPTVTGEDSGELITAAYFFGAPHPPGYPLWTMLCGLWTHLIPFGNVAWRANLFSASCMALAVVVLASCLRRMQFRPVVAGAAAMVCGLTSAVWSQCVIAEVYTLNLLVLAVLVWVLVNWWHDQNVKWLLWGSLALGLGISNHHIIGLAAVGLGIWAVIRSPRLLLDYRLIARCALMFALGLTPYLYLLWAGGRDVPVKWGETATISAAWEHVSRGQYKSEHPVEAQIPLTLGGYFGRLYYLARWEFTQFTPILMPLIAAGVVWLWRRRGRRSIFWLTVIAGATSGPLFHYLGGPQLDRQDEFVNKVFLTPIALISAIPLAAGMQWALAASRRLLCHVTLPTRRRLALAGACGVVLAPLCTHWGDNNMRHYWYAYDHAKNMLACMLPNAIIFPSGDHNTFPLLYLIHVEGIRPDVTVGDKYGYIDLDLYRDMPQTPGKPRTLEEREAIESWVIRHSRRPVYFTVKKTSSIKNAQLVPVGLLYHLLPEKMELDAESCWRAIGYRNLAGLSAPMDLASMNIVADYHYAGGVRALVKGQRDLAKAEFRATLDVAWGMKEIFNNAASALADHDLLDEAIVYYEAAAKMDWRYGPARWNLAKIFQASGRYDWAAKVFEDLTKAAPGDFRPYGELGFLFARHLGDQERARYWWYESLRLNPAQPQIIDALAELQRMPVTTQPTEAINAHEALQVSESAVDLGEVVAGETVTREVTVTNNGTTTIALDQLGSTCGCLKAASEVNRLEPGAMAEITLAYSPVGKMGLNRESVTLKGSGDIDEHLVVTITAQVVPEFTTEPSSVDWTVVAGKTPPERTITLRHHRKVPFSVESVALGDLPLKVEWDRDVFTATHELKLSFAKSIRENLKGEVEIRTSLVDHLLSRVPVSIRMELPIQAAPPVIYLGLVQPGQVVERSVLITSRHEDNERNLHLSLEDPSPRSGVDVSLTETNAGGATWRLVVHVDGDRLPPGVFQEKLRIGIDGFDGKLEVQLYGIAPDRRD